MSLANSDNESERLNSLYQLNLLDTPAEKNFDDLTKLTAQICGVPAAFISLVDAERVWFKSRIGIDAAEIPRSNLFCSCLALDETLVVINDTAEDSRSAGNPLIAGEGQFRFYAGAPLITGDGCVLGTLSIFDKKPREFSAEQAETLLMLARQVVSQLESRRSLAALECSNQSLRASEERYRFLAETVPQQVWTALPDGQLDYSNSRTTEYFRKKIEKELLGMDWLQVLHPDDVAQCVERWTHSLKTGDTYENEFRLRRVDGEYRWHLAQATPMRDGTGKIVKWFGTNTDIHDRKTAEENLRQSLEYSNLFRHASDAIIIFDAGDETIVDANERACEIYGFTRETFIGTNLKNLSENAEREAHHLNKLLKQNTYEEFESVHYRRDGSIVHFMINASIIEYQGRKAVLSINRDITERVRMEAELRTSEAELRTLFDSMNDVILVIDKDGRCLKIAPTNPNLLYKTPEEAVGRLAHDFLPKEQADAFVQCVRRAIEINQPVKIEYPMEIGEDIMWFAATATRMTSETVLWVARDITELKRASAASLESQQTLQLVVDTIPHAVFWKDRNSVYIGCNRFLAEILGLTDAGQAVGKTDYDFCITREEADSYRSYDRRVMTTGNPEYNFIETITLMDGNEQFVETNKVPLRDANNEIIGILGTFQDITARKQAEAERIQLEAQLRQSQRMESVGTLAGGIAHDFNNLLTVITGNAQLARRRGANDEKLEQRLEEIEKAADRAAALTRQLLAFSRLQQLERKSLDLNTTVSGVLKMLDRIIGENIEIQLSAAANLKTIFADAGQVEQILMNLCVNARDSMPDGGCLRIETRSIALNADSPRREYIKPGCYTQLLVSDTGTGMTDNVKQRIFEPFFTTKEVTAGTGLGLSTVYGIVKQHEGYVEVISELGRGTTFEVYFPVDEHIAAPEISENTIPLEGGREKILVAEDEAPLREIAHDILELLGYDVILAKDGIEFVELFEKFKNEIDLVMLDIVMPRLSGNRAYELICRDSDIPVPVIFMTGYSDKMLDNHLLEEKSHSAYLQKPYSVETLGRKVREILDSSRKTQ